MKFFSRIKEFIPGKKTPLSLSAKVTPEMLAAWILYAAYSHMKGIENNLRAFEKAVGKDYPLPDLRADAGFRTLEESLKALWAFAHTQVVGHFQDSLTANLYHTLLVRELTKLSLESGVSLTEEKLMEAWRLYSPYSPRPLSKEEVLKNYTEYVIAPAIAEDPDDWAALALNIFHARVLRALGVTVSGDFILCEGLFATNGSFLVHIRSLFEKIEPVFGDRDSNE